MNKLIAVTIGDIEGIGIKLLLKEWGKKKLNNFVLFSNSKILKKYLSKNKLKIKLNEYNKNYIYDKRKLNIFNIESKNNYTNTYNSLIESYHYTKKKYFIGVVTLPLNKFKIIKNINKNFIDQTNLYKKLDNKKINNMLFFYKNKFFTPLTTHLKLSQVSKTFINKSNILNKIKIFNKSIKKDFKINNPKILISGINPHTGESGTIGKDEIKNLIPIIKKLKKSKINITGPISGDSMINKINLQKYDCFIFAYHDQALIPYKLLSNNSGVNYTSNLNIIRTSPDHGTAYDLVKKGKVSSKALINAFIMARKIYKNRLSNC